MGAQGGRGGEDTSRTQEEEEEDEEGHGGTHWHQAAQRSAQFLLSLVFVRVKI